MPDDIDVVLLSISIHCEEGDLLTIEDALRDRMESLVQENEVEYAFEFQMTATPVKSKGSKE